MRTKLIIGLTIVLGAVVLFFLSGGGKGRQVFYMTPTEFAAAGNNNGERARLTGRVGTGTIRIAANKLDLDFVMEDGTTKVPIHYKGTVPEAFAEGLDVVVDGRMGVSVFEAKEIIVKCPSKYESKLDRQKKGN